MESKTKSRLHACYTGWMVTLSVDKKRVPGEEDIGGGKISAIYDILSLNNKEASKLKCQTDRLRYRIG